MKGFLEFVFLSFPSWSKACRFGRLGVCRGVMRMDYSCYTVSATITVLQYIYQIINDISRVFTVPSTDPPPHSDSGRHAGHLPPTQALCCLCNPDSRIWSGSNPIIPMCALLCVGCVCVCVCGLPSMEPNFLDTLTRNTGGVRVLPWAGESCITMAYIAS